MSPFKALYGRDATLPSSVALNLPLTDNIDLKQAFTQLMKVQMQASDTLYQTKSQYQDTSDSRAPLHTFSPGDQFLTYQSWDNQFMVN